MTGGGRSTYRLVLNWRIEAFQRAKEILEESTELFSQTKPSAYIYTVAASYLEGFTP